MAQGHVHIGTSGWHYRHWVGPFYPAGTRPAQYLSLYARRFSTVEINATFYRLPSEHAVRQWHAQTPSRFLFACKASRYTTHVKRLRDGADSTARFFEAIAPLGEKVGPILFQLPPDARADAGRLVDFLDALPSGRRYVFEFRHTTWFSKEVEAALTDHGAALCLHDFDGMRTPSWQCAPFVYVRLHGPSSGSDPSYGHAALSHWARRIREWRSQGTDVHCYFNNDAGCAAIRDALDLVDQAS